MLEAGNKEISSLYISRQFLSLQGKLPNAIALAKSPQPTCQSTEHLSGNCDETGLYYELLPEKSLVTHFDKSADGHKSQKERVTINTCSSVTGTIKLPLLFIGKSKNPLCFKNINHDNLPVVYANQSNAWVNAVIFAD